jgi:malate dehydrogenase (oxaloacetate-decarboxylating)(NADP+)
MVLVLTKEGMKAFADVTVNIDPTPDQLARIAVQTARFVRAFGIEPRVAMLSFESFGGSPSPQAEKVRRATEIVKAVAPDLVVDGEMRVDVATVPAIAAEHYPFSAIQGDANVLVFPSLEAANIGVELLSRMGGATLIGPVMLGMGKAVNVMPQGSDVDEIVNLAAFTVVKAQGKELDL